MISITVLKHHCFLLNTLSFWHPQERAVATLAVAEHVDIVLRLVVGGGSAIVDVVVDIECGQFRGTKSAQSWDDLLSRYLRQVFYSQ